MDVIVAVVALALLCLLVVTEADRAGEWWWGMANGGIKWRETTTREKTADKP